MYHGPSYSKPILNPYSTVADECPRWLDVPLSDTRGDENNEIKCSLRANPSRLGSVSIRSRRNQVDFEAAAARMPRANVLRYGKTALPRL